MKMDAVRKHALSLPETTEEPHFDFTSFRVKGKIFATAPAGGEYLHVFVDEQTRDPLIAANPAVYSGLAWGARIVGVKILLAPADSASVRRLLLESWKRKAPNKLLAALE